MHIGEYCALFCIEISIDNMPADMAIYINGIAIFTEYFFSFFRWLFPT